MSFTAEGTIEIDYKEFLEWVIKTQLPTGISAELQLGVARVNKSNETLEIDFALGTNEVHPRDWFVKPKAYTQWLDNN